MKCDGCDGKGYVLMDEMETKEDEKNDTWKILEERKDIGWLKGTFIQIDRQAKEAFIWTDNKIVMKLYLDGEIKN